MALLVNQFRFLLMERVFQRFVVGAIIQIFHANPHCLSTILYRRPTNHESKHEVGLDKTSSTVSANGPVAYILPL